MTPDDATPRPRRRPPFPLDGLLPDGATSQAEVLDVLRQAIITGSVPPAAVISPEVVAKHLSVSPIPVREALRTLIGEGLVEHRPHAPYTVAQLSPAELDELYVIRGVLETAALRAAVPRATADDDEAAAAALDGLAAAVTAGDRAAYHRESRRFHLALVRASGMVRLVGLLESTWNLTEPYRPMDGLVPQERAALHDEHTSMLAAFVARDADHLVAVSLAHHDHLHRVVADAVAAREENP